MSDVAAMRPFPQWEEPPIHPVNTAPKMSEKQLRELADDIKKHGMHEPIILWRDNREEASGSKGPFPIFLLDGVNRWAALKLLGVTDPGKAKIGSIVDRTVRTLNAIKQISAIGQQGVSTKWIIDCDPAAFHLSMNVYRRHLTAEQKRWMIKQAIVAEPRASDREIARKTKTSHSTVAATRGGMMGQNGQSGQNDPLERAKKTFSDNPTLSKRKLAEIAGVSVGTAAKARKNFGVDGNPRKQKKSIPDDDSVPLLNKAWANASDKEREAFVRSHSPDLRAILDGEKK